MHEAALAQNLFRIVQNALSGHEGAKVLKVNILAGALAGVMPDALCFAFDALKPGTPLASAEMVIQVQPVRVTCGDCGENYEPKAFPCVCPACRGRSFRILDGEDVIVQSLELDE
ncbi:MAG TPA: hydrogenase maturation nickel metallochaperone HypA [Clostridia bacterium]|nr:hydrogenase maturation nickel metallochaperone HypA [Clostridia bacterium]